MRNEHGWIGWCVGTLVLVAITTPVPSGCEAGNGTRYPTDLPGESGADRESSLEFGKVIPVLLEAGVEETAGVARLEWIRFEREEEQVVADLRIVLLSWPKGKWEVRGRLSDSQGRELSDARVVFENSGRIVTRPGIREGDLRLTFGTAEMLDTASRFRVEIAESVSGETVPSTLTPPPRPPRPAGGDRSLDVTLEGPGPERVGKVELTVWRQAVGALDPPRLSALEYRPVLWRRDDSSWQPWRHIALEQDTYTISDLPEGVYRVTAISGRGLAEEDPTPSGETGTIDLTGSRMAARAALALEGENHLTVNVIDQETGDPVARECLLLRDPGGAPIGPGSRRFCLKTDGGGTFRFASLRAGTYRLEIGPRDWRSEIDPESVKVVRAEVEADRENEITVRIEPRQPPRR